MASITRRFAIPTYRFDRRGRFVWALTIAALLGQQIVFAAAGYRAAGVEPWRTLVVGVPLLTLAGVLRSGGKDRLPCLIEAVVLLRVAAFSFFLLQFPIIEFGWPVVDDLLLRADTLLGFDWTSFASLFADPVSDFVLIVAYGMFRIQAVFVLPYLCLKGQTNRAWQFVTAALGSMAFVVVTLSIFAADGSHVGCGLRPAGLPFHETYCVYGLIIHETQAGAIKIINDWLYVGLGSFPSFHVAGGVLYVWAVWHSQLVRWPMLVLNLLLSVGAVVIGGHYFVDVLGGVLLAIGAIVIVQRLLPDNGRQPSAARAQQFGSRELDRRNPNRQRPFTISQ